MIGALRTVLAAGVLTALLAAQPPTGSIQGRVTDDSNQPVDGARVTAARLRASGSGPLSEGLPAVTGQGGNFTVSGLSPGDYRICVEMPGSNFLNPCTWDSAPPAIGGGAGQPAAVGLGSGQRVTGVGIQLKKGIPVRVRLDDPGGLLAPAEAAGREAHVLVGAWTAAGLFQPARLTAKDSVGRTLTVLIPYDASVRVTVRGHKVQLQDEGGRALAPGDFPVNLRAAREETEKTLRFRIAGVQN